MAMLRSDMEKMLGPLDNHLAAEIAATGASAEELAEALVWIGADEAMINDGRRMPSGRVAQLISLLEIPEDPEQASPPP